MNDQDLLSKLAEALARKCQENDCADRNGSCSATGWPCDAPARLRKMAGEPKLCLARLESPAMAGAVIAAMTDTADLAIGSSRNNAKYMAVWDRDECVADGFVNATEAIKALRAYRAGRVLAAVRAQLEA